MARTFTTVAVLALVLLAGCSSGIDSTQSPTSVESASDPPSTAAVASTANGTTTPESITPEDDSLAAAMADNENLSHIETFSLDADALQQQHSNALDKWNQEPVEIKQELTVKSSAYTDWDTEVIRGRITVYDPANDALYRLPSRLHERGTLYANSGDVRKIYATPTTAAEEKYIDGDSQFIENSSPELYYAQREAETQDVFALSVLDNDTFLRVFTQTTDAGYKQSEYFSQADDKMEGQPLEDVAPQLMKYQGQYFGEDPVVTEYVGHVFAGTDTGTASTVVLRIHVEDESGAATDFKYQTKLQFDTDRELLPASEWASNHA